MADAETVEETPQEVTPLPEYTPCPDAIDVTPHGDGGVLKEIKTPGCGEESPQEGDKVFVHYVGTLTDGTKFDSSRDRDKPFEFNLGKGNVIKSWDMGVATMKKGEVSMLICKPEYAYGETGSPPKIPPNATLLFEVELLDWKGEDLSPNKDGGITRRQIVKGQGYSSPNEGALLEVHLVGRHSGHVFDDRDVSFHLGEGSEHDVPEGLEKALEKFKKGEKSVIKLKPKFGFGSSGNAKFNIPSDADVEYEVELKTFEKAKESWELNGDEKLEQSKLYKEKGTNYFKLGKMKLAEKQYKKITSFLEHESSLEGEQEDERKSILLAGHLNLAACYLKLDDYVEAKSQCEKALKLDPNSEKGFFRRGMAFFNMGEAELAKDDFRRVMELAPSNKAAANQLVLCRKKIQEQKDKDKRLYANMFDKFARIDREKEEAQKRKEPMQVVETGEWGKGEESRANEVLDLGNGESMEVIGGLGVAANNNMENNNFDLAEGEAMVNNNTDAL